MKTIDKQKRVAEKVLAKLETFDPTCILAGGAPRDWFFGNVASDLDFYVHFRPDFQNQKWRYSVLLETLGLKMVAKTGDELPVNYKRNPHLITVYQGKVDGEVVQVMFMDKPTFHCVVDLFPFGICQAWWKGKKHTYSWNNEEIHTTADFNAAVKNKVLILLNELYNDSDGYVQKIKDKFPEYTFYNSFESFCRDMLYK